MQSHRPGRRPVLKTFLPASDNMQRQFFIEDKKTRLYSVLHIPHHSQTVLCKNVGIIYCHPFIYEHFYSYPTSASLSRALCQEDIPVLRLDLQGYGNSQGNLEEVGFLDWVSDIKAAIRFLESIVDKGNVGLIGLRLGANIAMYSASTSAIRLPVLCDPILDFDKLGMPTLNLYGKAENIADQMGVRHTVVSISHIREYAVACVLLEG